MKAKNALCAALIVLVAVFAQAAPANASPMDTWGGDITKVSLSYYTFDEFGFVTQNSVNLAKPKGALTPNTVLTTTYPDPPTPLVNMSMRADVNGRFFLSTEGELLTDSRGASGHSVGSGVLLLDNGLTFNPATEELIGSGELIYFDAAVDIAARSRSSSSGPDTGAAKLGMRFARAVIVTVTDGDPDFDNEVTTKLVLKSLSTKFTLFSRVADIDAFEYSPYGGTWNYVFTPTDGLPEPVDIGVPQAGTLELNMNSNGESDFDTGNGCGSTYAGLMRGLVLSLYSNDEAGAVDGVNCSADGALVVTFTDANSGSGSATITDSTTGGWHTGTLTLTRP